ncbi:MAG: DNA primase [Candidatus Pacebacteria bacterium]|nr:DNA primase [Candidatus Paceibacterota bacterium]
MISSPIEEIKNRLDIVEVIQGYIKLHKAGVNYRAICPFHNEKKPSFFVSPVRQRWHCFGSCSEGGDIFKFVMKIEGLEFGDALRLLAQRAGVELKRQDPVLKTQRQRLYEICELACSFFQKQLKVSSLGKEARDYFLSRGIKEETIDNWRLGYAPDMWNSLSDFLISRGYIRQEVEKAGLALKSQKTGSYFDRFRGRIIFPIFDFNSQPIGFGARIFKQTKRADGQDESKYINTPATLLYDKSSVLYGLNRAGLEIRKKDASVLVEGYMDALMAHQAGYSNVVAVSGTALTSYQLKTLKRYSDNLLISFDMDLAGNSATKRGIDLAQEIGFNIRIVVMPEGSDPADVILKDPNEWQNLIEKTKTIHDFYFENALSKFDRNTLEGKKGISKILLPVIKRIPDKIEQSVWIQDLAKALLVKEEDVSEELRKITFGPGKEVMPEESNYISKDYCLSKSRKDLLEEFLLVLAVKSPGNLDLLKDQDYNLFSVRFCQIVKYFKEKGIGNRDSFPLGQEEFLNLIFTKAEIEQSDINPCQEFEKCFRDFKVLTIREKLAEISKKIKEAESENNYEMIKYLTNEFNSFSKFRCDLENA